ncbi:MAG: SH3 domain-containing protein [Treponema sp.]
MRFIRLVFFLTLTFLFLSCSDYLGYGIVIWTGEGIEVGDVVKVYAKSDAAKTYIVSNLDQENKKEVPMWKILLRKNKKEIEKLEAKLESLQFMYAASTFDGLPIREHPDNLSKQVYRLKEDQVVKLLWEGDGIPVMRGEQRVEGAWYEVMTNEGIQGWCFSHYLDIYDGRIGRKEGAKNTVGIMVEKEEDEIEDPALMKVLNATWVPEYYRTMLVRKTVNLDKISTSYGFFPGAKTNVARVNLPTIQRTFPYSKIKKERDKYRFSGSPLSMYIRNVDVITIEFTDEAGTRLYENFVTINADVETVIENEKERRNEEIKKLMANYISQNYGNLSIAEEGVFYWTNYEALTPFIISSGAENAGKVSIKYFVSKKIRKETAYVGVLSFQFYSLKDSIDFMYGIKDGSLILEAVSENAIEDGIVVRRENSPILYFELSKTSGKF